MYSSSPDGIISTNIMTALRTSLICTVYNEEKNIGNLIDSISKQSLKPTEVIIVDGGSKDKTVELINIKIKKFPKLRIKLFVKKGNRSVGRNEAIKRSSYNIILSTDSGCLLDNNWVKNMVKHFYIKSTDVVAGYYKGRAKNVFEKSLIPYVLVTEDRANKKNFLPATRSMAFRKNVWNKLNGFNEMLSHNEDFEFANRIKQAGFNIKFEKKALVYWIPRQNIFQSFKMFARFAYGDIEAGLIRNKVIYIFLRYLFAMYLLALAIIMKSNLLNLVITSVVIIYILWAVIKNYKYVNLPKAAIYLPVLQLVSDTAVIFGSSWAFIRSIRLNSLRKIIINNKVLFIILLLYVITMLSMINWGIPNPSHPFNYFMDEWHQSQSIRNLFILGSPNVEGSANGSIFQFFLTGIYLIPFVLFGVVNPSEISSSIANLDTQKTLFEILRLNTLAFGVLSIIIFYYLTKKFIKLNPLISTFLFVFNPVWIMLSNYYKYDIALTFWTLLAFIFIFRYIKRPNFMDLLLSLVISAIALSVKLSPFALPFIIGIVFFSFTDNPRKKIKWLVVSIAIYLIVFVSLGIPDILLGKGNLNEYLSSVLIRTPSFTVSNFITQQNIWLYLISNVYTSLFGYVLLLASFFYFTLFILKSSRYFISQKILLSKEMSVIALSFVIFAVILYPLKLDAGNNRALTLLPFLAIFAGYGVSELNKFVKVKYLKYSIVTLLLLMQLGQTLSWVIIKINPDPRQLSSQWMVLNLKANSTIGIENIPIYQGIPDLALKEFYVNENSVYKYETLNINRSHFPKYVILTNEDLSKKYFKKTQEKELSNILKKQNYVKIAQFKPNNKYLNYYTNDINYFLSGIVQAPLEISIYEKR